ncbi:MAG: hypothetical protein H7Y30_07640 [Pyrinomonadaceae bacterium]|nr:hypothetical protein [Pyrinomonadaceae bacterium]
MKHLRQVCAATILALIISVSAFAGEMDTSGIIPSPPPPPPPVTGEMDTGGRPANSSSSETGYTYDAVTEAALLFCQNVLSLL